MGGAALRIGVYSRFWNTAGGGEVYAGTLAEILSRDHQVELVSETAIDVERLRERLDLRLEGLPTRVLGEVDDWTFGQATQNFDLFVNCSHGSQRRSGGHRGIYVVHFPEVGEVRGWTSPVARNLGRRFGHGGRIEWGPGVHPEETDGLNSWRWTDSSGTIYVHAPPGRRLLLDLALSTTARPSGSEAGSVVTVDGVRRAGIAPVRAQEVITVPIVGGDGPVLVRIDTEPFSPRKAFGADDPRQLGLQVERAELRATGLLGLLTRRLPSHMLEPEPHEFLSSYSAIVSNSQFTARWVKKRWRRLSAVLEPPVRLRSAGDKAPVILSVGRFFGPGSGHSKRQLEMVRAFAQLLETVTGWELHLAGGCSEVDRPYLRIVEAEIGHLPVHLHVNAPATTLDELYAKASIYWHAAGLGEDAESHPERLEHFGISVVEAMSAGAVPVVLAQGGPADIVRAGRDGIHFVDSAGLVRATQKLIDDEAMRRTMAGQAGERAQRYGRAEFEGRATALLAEVLE